MRRSRARVAAIAVLAVALSAFAHIALAQAAPPVITAPADGSKQPGVEHPVTIRGTAAAGSNIEVFDTIGAPGSIGTTVTASNGRWSIAVPLGDGDHAVNAVASDGSSMSAPSNLVRFTVDAIRPSAAITSPANETLFEPGQQVVISGNATDDRTVHAIRLEFWLLNKLDRAVLADCTGCDDGTSATWTHSPALQPGHWRVKVWSFDGAGNPSIAGWIDFTTTSSDVPYEQPSIPGVPQILPPQILGPGDGSTQAGADRPITFSGTSEPGARISFYENVQGLGKIGTAVDDDENGTWTWHFRFPSGTYGIRARARDDQGNVSSLSDLIVFEVDGERPVIGGLPEGALLFSPLEPVRLTGTITDVQATRIVVLEYWLGNTIVLRDAAVCARCGKRTATWWHEPTLPNPGYYHVRVLSFDRAGNPAHEQAITFFSSNI